MGLFSKPKIPKQIPAPPPVTTTGAEIAAAKDAAMADLADNQGYEWSMNPTKRKSLLSKPATVRPRPVAQPKSLLSAS